MALRGNLKDFTLPDVFQLITASKKTGILRISGPDEAEGSVWFRDGDVFFAQSNWHHEKLGERLVASQKITPSALARVLQIQSSEPAGRRLGQILVDENYITGPILEAFVQEQIQETVFDLMRWDEGEFDFELLPRLVDEDIGLTVSMENIIMEGSRRLEEWARIKRKVPSMEIVFRMATAPGEGTFEISLKPIEWNLLLLIDGTRSVDELARATGRTDFEVARIVYGLYSAGLLEVTPDDEVSRLRSERAERDARRRAAAESERAIAQASREVSAEVIESPRQPASAPAPERVEPPEPLVADEAIPAASPELPAFLSAAPSAPADEDMAILEEMIGTLLDRTAGRTAEVAAPAPETAPGETGPQGTGVAEAEKTVEEEVLPAAPAESVEYTEVSILESIEYVPEAEIVPETELPSVRVGETTHVPEELIVPEQVPVPEAETPAEQMPERPVEVSEAEAEAAISEITAEPLTEPVLEPPAAPGAYEREEPLPAETEAGPQVFVEPASTVEAYVEPATEPRPSVEELAAEQIESHLQPVVEPASVFFDETVETVPEAVEVPEIAGALEEEVEAEQAPAVSEADVLGETPPGAEPPELSEILERYEEESAAVELIIEPGRGAEDIVTPEALEPTETGRTAESEESPVAAGSAGAPRAPGEFDEVGPDMGLTGALSGEISALTGVGRPRPPTIVKNLESGAARLRRDAAVDRATLLKIIDGIKNL